MTLNASKASALWHIEHLESPVDGLKIRYGHTGSERPKRGLLFLNGRSEWIEKYEHLPPEMDLGEDVLWVTMDHRGQGASEGARAHIQDYRQFAQDAAAVARASFGDMPYSVLTHSMGGLIALVAMIEGGLKPEAAVLCSPLLAIPHVPLHRSLAKPLARFISKSALRNRTTGVRPDRDQNFHSNSLTHSFANFQKILASPYPYVAPTFGWVHATFVACDLVFAPENLAKIKCRVKIIYGSEERVVDPSVYPAWCEAFHKETGLEVDLFRIPEARHELLNEIPRLRVQVEQIAKDWLSIR